MTRFIGPLIVFVLSAAAVHAGALLLLPHYVMAQVFNSALTAGATNSIVHAPRIDASSRQIVRPSPDLLYSLCAYDLGAGPLHVRAPVPPGTYWSVSAYADNTDNFFSVNDRQAGLDVVEFLLVPRGARIADDLPQIQATGRRGVILMRTLIAGGDVEQLDRVRREATCATFVPPTPGPEALPEGGAG